MAPVVFGVSRVFGAVFFLALGLFSYALFAFSSRRGWVLVVLFAASLACLLWGGWLLWRWLADRKEALRMMPPESSLAGRPWLRVEAWRRRSIVSGRLVGTPILLLAYLFFGGPALLMLGVGIVDPETRSGESLRFPGLLIGSLLAFVVAGLTYWRLRYRKYGDSVCRLLTLPGRVGGRFEADIDCALPAGGDGTVLLRLKNCVQAGRTARIVWQMEQSIVVPVQGERSVVPVRLDVPRAREQQLLAPGAGALERFAAPWWVLEVEKAVPGIDFKAQFGVPVYDVPESVALEAVPPASGAPVDDRTGRRTAAAILVAALAVFAFTTHRATEDGWLSASLFAPSADWMPVERFRREYAAWWPAHCPTAIEGRCADGREEYRSEWTPSPAGTTCHSWYGMGREWFERYSRSYGAQGFRLTANSRFAGCRGVELFQATWIKAPP